MDTRRSFFGKAACLALAPLLLSPSGEERSWRLKNSGVTLLPSEEGDIRQGDLFLVGDTGEVVMIMTGGGIMRGVAGTVPKPIRTNETLHYVGRFPNGP